MQIDVRGASRKDLRLKLRRRLRGRRAVLTTAAASVVGVLVIAGVVPAIAAGTDEVTPFPVTPAASQAPTDAPAPDESASAEPDAGTAPQDESAPQEEPAQPETDAAADQPRLRSFSGLESGGISLLSAPTIPSGQAAITVNVRALRTASGSATATSPTAGVQLQLHADASGGSGSSAYNYPGAAIVGAWATCTTDADGDCNFVVPTSGLKKRYWVLANGTAGTQSFLSQHLITGNNTNSGTDKFAATPYAFRTPEITASQTPYQLPGTGTTNMPTNSRVGNPTLPVSATVATKNRWDHYSGDMVTTLNNPRYVPTCKAGLKVALIIDTSTSMTYNDNEGITGAKTASKAFATQFADKGVTLGIYRFGTNAAQVKSPAEVTGANLNTFTKAINDITIGNSEYTNWDAGIAQIQNQGFDLAVVLTDGNPTRSTAESAGGTWTNLVRLEAAMLSANLVKSQGTQMLAFGVGDYIQAALPQNLQAVTGKTGWTPSGGISIGDADYAITSDWGVVSSQLANLASSLTCEATVQIHKQERAEPNGPLTNGSGWQFTPVKSGSGTLTPATAQVTGTNGLLPSPWRIAFTATDQTAALKVTETPKTGWSVESVSCANNGAAIAGIPNAAEFTLPTLAVGDHVVCTVVNAQVPKSATVVVDKVWTITDSSGAVTGTYREPAQPGDAALPQGLSATPVVADQDRVWGTVYTGFAQQQQVAITERASVDAQKLPGCTLTSMQLTGANGQTVTAELPYTATLQTGANSFTLTNTVTCEQTLSLVKKVAFGDAPADSWTLSADAPDGSGALAGPSGTYTAPGSVTAPVTAGIAYALAETGGPAEYIQDGEWACVNGSATVAVTGATVTVPLGANVTCTAVNTTAELVLLKHVEDSALSPADWTLSATPGSTGLAVKTALGAAEASAANTFEIKPGAQYTISEALTGGAGTIAYRQLAIQQQQPDGSWVTVTSDTITVPAGKTATYRFVNDSVPAVVLPLTGGASTDAFLFGGALALLLAAALAVWQVRRTVATRRI